MNKQIPFKSSIGRALLIFATITLMTTATAQAATVAIYKFTAVISAGDIEDKKVDASDYGFNSGDILSARVFISSNQTDTDSHADKGQFENGTLDLSFTITSAGGVVVYSSSSTSSQDTELKIHNNYNGKDKLELEDKSDRGSISNGGTTLNFNKFKIKLEDNGESALAGTTPVADLGMSIVDWGDKAEYEIEWKGSGGREIKLKGDLSSVSAVPIPAAAWLFGSALLALFSIARRRPA
ncbi:MAG: hypothetical protein OSA77_02555 [Halioglobus sp.]|jgi:hypothetical protein|nr:hypothetical protein [Halioglobus sp.]